MRDKFVLTRCHTNVSWYWFADHVGPELLVSRDDDHSPVRGLYLSTTMLSRHD